MEGWGSDLPNSAPVLSPYMCVSAATVSSSLAGNAARHPVRPT